MAKDQKDKINELKLKLGDLAYRQGKQAVICRETWRMKSGTVTKRA
jgi:hypothetical protein